ncbi:MAG TPA: PLP-dependent aminotransferase family protein [Myxococcales bacterium]|nr:PLP-dependent aminotransferase family protein [Myxococcales bacterium]
MALHAVQSVGLTLHPEREEPLYRQLFDQVVERIRNGAFPAGYRLPPTRDLAGALGTHRNTVVRAYEELESAGFVHSTVGRGTFVAPSAVPVEPQAAAAPARAGLPWASLISGAASSEALVRSDRLARTVSSLDAINLQRMQPAAELMPHRLLRRCMDHVMQRQASRALGYSPREGLPRLRELVAEDLARQGIPAAAEDLIITTGSQQALYLVACALINPGDPFLVDESTYYGAVNIISAARGRMIPVPNDGEGPDLAVLERHARVGAKGLYLMPGCHNPTGRRISAARREALVAWSHRSNVPLLEDDYASDLLLDDAPLPAMRALDGEVVYLGTYSKKLSPALRIGYLLAPRGLRGPLSSLKHAMDLGTSPLLQHATAEFLERGYLRPHLSKVVSEYRKRRDALCDALEQSLPPSARWERPKSGVFAWIQLPAWMDPDALFQEGQRHGVLVSPGTQHGVGGDGHRGVRLTYCYEPIPRLEEGARRLGKAWMSLERRVRGRAAPSQDLARFEVV